MSLCGPFGVLLIAICFWASLATMLAASLLPNWCSISFSSSSSGLGSHVVSQFGPLQSCTSSTSSANIDTCTYMTLQTFKPTTMDLCTDAQNSAVSTCSQAVLSLFGVRLCFVIFLFLQFIGAGLATLAPCTCWRANTSRIMFRRAKFASGFAELFQILIICFWYLIYSNSENVVAYDNSVNSVSGSESVSLDSAFFVGVASCGFPLLASMIDCVTTFAPTESERGRGGGGRRRRRYSDDDEEEEEGSYSDDYRYHASTATTTTRKQSAQSQRARVSVASPLPPPGGVLASSSSSSSSSLSSSSSHLSSSRAQQSQAGGGASSYVYIDSDDPNSAMYSIGPPPYDDLAHSSSSHSSSGGSGYGSVAEGYPNKI